MSIKVLAIDPGRGKCGVAVVDGDRHILDRAVVDRSGLVEAVRELVEVHGPSVVVMGNSTGVGAVMAELKDLVSEIPSELVDERNSTLEARHLYFEHHPPRGLWCLVPLSLRYPPEPFDDFAAVILADRYLAKKT